MRRTVIPELLDEDLGTPAEIASNLRDLRTINERFGGTRTTVDLLRRVAAHCGRPELSLLEVAAGSGDVPMAAQRELAKDGIALNVTLLDRKVSHIDGSGSVAAVCADALQLPFKDGVFDIVSCGLFAHHLEPGELQRFVLEAQRVCRRVVLINDLVRSALHFGLVFAAQPLFHSRLTRHDGLASVRRAYTVTEMRVMLNGVPAAGVEISKHFLFRMGVLVWKAGN